MPKMCIKFIWKCEQQFTLDDLMVKTTFQCFQEKLFVKAINEIILK